MNAHLARACAALAALAALVLSPFAVEAAPKERRSDCLRKGTTLDANGKVRLFRVGTREEPVVYACRLRDRFVFMISADPDDFSYGPDLPVLAGRFVAGIYADCSSQGCSSYVRLFDVDRGRTREGSPHVGSVTSLQVTRQGVAAWIGGVDPPLDDQPVTDRRVEVGFGDGIIHVLDEGPGIAERSLARSGSRLYWIKDGRPQTATLAQARLAPQRP